MFFFFYVLKQSSHLLQLFREILTCLFHCEVPEMLWKLHMILDNDCILIFFGLIYPLTATLTILKSCIMEWWHLEIRGCIVLLWVLGGKSRMFLGALCWIEPAVQLIRHIVLQVETCRLTWKRDKAFVLLWVWLKQPLPAFTWQKCNLSCVTQITVVYLRRGRSLFRCCMRRKKNTQTHSKTRYLSGRCCKRGSDLDWAFAWIIVGKPKKKLQCQV